MNIRNEKLVGNLTKDPVQKTHGENTFTEITVAVNLKSKNGEEKARYFDITFIGKIGDAVNNIFQKGSGIAVLGGYTDVETWNDKETGQLRFKEVLRYPESFLALASIKKADPNASDAANPLPAPQHQEDAQAPSEQQPTAQ